MGGIEHISVKGFKSLKSVDLILGPITLLIGANGAGKSNFIEVFRFLDALRMGDMQQYVLTAGRANNLLHFGSRNTERLELKIGLARNRLTYRIELVPTWDDLLVIPSQDGQQIGTQGIPGYANEESPARIPVDPRTGIPTSFEASIQRDVDWGPGLDSYLIELLDGHRIYEFSDTQRLKNTGPVDDNRWLKSDGSNLPAVLYLLSQRHRESYRSIVQAIRQTAPFFRDFDLEPDRLNPNWIRLRWRHAGSTDYFDASSLSGGSLRFIALSTILLQPVESMPRLIIIDEAELGLHPHAVTLLGSLIQRASIDTRLIVTTQSPLLVDQFEPEDVVVIDRVGGASKFRRLDSGELAVWMEDYSLGELWQKNNLGARPSPE